MSYGSGQGPMDVTWRLLPLPIRLAVWVICGAACAVAVAIAIIVLRFAIG